MKIPQINGLLNYHIRGDDALLYLGRDRYERAGMGAEIHPSSPEHLADILKFTPQGRKSTVHLPYSVVLDHDDTETVTEFVIAGGERISGYVLHDTFMYQDDFQTGVELIRKLSSKLMGKTPGIVFIEYAVGLSFDTFYRLAETVKGLPNIGICIDIGHLAVKSTDIEYTRRNPTTRFSELRTGVGISSETYEIIAEAVSYGREASLEFIERLCALGVPLHFHLHDGHPLSTFSPYNICDHIPFFWEVPTHLPEVGPVSGIYGVSGLRKVLEIVLKKYSPEELSFTLEIHPQPGRKDLELQDQKYFSSWTDLTNAKAMNFWMDLVVQNAMVFNDLCRDVMV